jgi:cytochrome c-type biogenesis protein CcmE
MKGKYIFGLVVALGLIATAVYSVDKSKIEYMDFPTAVESGNRAQIAGTWVREKDMKYDPAKNEFRFTMRDEKGNEMPVVLNGAKPNNFEIAVSVVATGAVEEGTFHASNILTKCPSKYEASPKDLQKYEGTMGRSAMNK